MDQDILEHIESLVHKTGMVISVDEEAIKRLIYKGEGTLGFEHEKRKFKVRYLPQEIREATRIKAGYDCKNNRFLVAERQHETTIFHEGIHYLMHQDGLLFIQRKENMIYDRLVDETVAELATAERYGFSELMGSNFYASDFPSRLEHAHLEQIIEDVKKSGIEKKTCLALKHLAKNVKALKVTAKTTLKIVNMHQEIEKKYLEKQNFAGIEADVHKFFDCVYPLSGLNSRPQIFEVIRMLSLDNARKLLQKGIDTQTAVSWIKDAVEKKWDSYWIYFVDIVGA